MGITKHLSELCAVKCVIEMVVPNLSFPSLLAVLHAMSLQLRFGGCVVHQMLHSHVGVIAKS